MLSYENLPFKSTEIFPKIPQNLDLSISNFSRDSRQKIPGNPGMKKGRESREFPVPGIPGVKLYTAVPPPTLLTNFFGPFDTKYHGKVQQR